MAGHIQSLCVLIKGLQSGTLQWHIPLGKFRLDFDAAISVISVRAALQPGETSLTEYSYCSGCADERS